jgi:hypothetical protein
MDIARGSLRIVAVALVSALLLGACQEKKDSTGRASQGPTLSAPTTSAPPSDEQQALTAYRGMWTAYVKAGLTANPDDPDLAVYATADALTLLRSGLSELRDEGNVVRGDLVTNPQVKSSNSTENPNTINITDCLDDSNSLVYVAKTGALLNDVPGGRRSTTAVVVKSADSSWKVSSFAAHAVGTC